MTNQLPAAKQPGRTPRLLLWAALAVGLAWSYWPTLEGMAGRWANDPQYSHGYVVPVFALVVLWSRRDRLPSGPRRPSWWGLGFVLAGAVLRLAGAYVSFAWLDAASLLPTLAGLCLLAAGWPALRWAWPAVAFLVFMLPLPYQLETGLAHPLQRLATQASTYTLQTLGLPAVAQGNVIDVDGLKIGVLGACSGLGMLATFFALATAVALVVRRPLWQRVTLVVSAAPIGVLMNLARITATGVLLCTAGSDVAKLVYHDLAGWLMMPLALGVLGLELWFLARLFVPVPSTGPVPLALPQPAAAGPQSPPPGTTPAEAGAAHAPADGSLLEIP
jgi:exosortase